VLGKIGKGDVLTRIVDDPESPAGAFFAVFPALDAVWDCAEQVRVNLDSQHRKPRHWEHRTDVRDDENLIHWVKELRKWLADERTNSLKQEYFRPFADALTLLDQIPPGADVSEICQLLETLQDAQDEIEAHTYDLAERALGQWGAYFFMANHDEVMPCSFEYDPRALEHVAVLYSAPASATGVFVPTPFQTSILAVLNGRAMKKQQLAVAVCGGEDNGNLLYRPGRITELRQNGLVANKRGIGYYRPDAPPLGAIDLR